MMMLIYNSPTASAFILTFKQHRGKLTLQTPIEKRDQAKAHSFGRWSVQSCVDETLAECLHYLEFLGKTCKGLICSYSKDHFTIGKLSHRE